MPTIGELITIFRKECEDLIYANLKATFLIQSDEIAATAGSNSVNFATAYGNTDYQVTFLVALDSNGINIQDACIITAQTESGFTFTIARNATVVWQAARRSPILNYPLGTFWTD